MTNAKKCDITGEFYDIEAEGEQVYALSRFDEDGNLQTLDIGPTFYSKLNDLIDSKGLKIKTHKPRKKHGMSEENRRKAAERMAAMQARRKEKRDASQAENKAISEPKKKKRYTPEEIEEMTSKEPYIEPSMPLEMECMLKEKKARKAADKRLIEGAPTKVVEVIKACTYCSGKLTEEDREDGHDLCRECRKNLSRYEEQKE